MYCKNCGDVISERSNFCASCGVRVITQDNSSNVISLHNNNYTNKNNNSIPVQDNNAIEDDNSESESTSLLNSLGQGLLGIVAIIIIIAIANAFIQNYKSSGSIDAAISDTVESISNLGDRSSDNTKFKMEIYNIAKDIMRNELSTPSTAEFPAFSNSFVSYNNSVYTVSAYVDHENLMGATVRSHFSFEITEKDDGYRYKIIEIY